ncbi:MAG: ABC transporter permease [Sulfobacillus acidophilus]|uniref:ABC transporter permease n=1 Tax=Sulfobacillus acidophilus TaxID=53633 RepID=A0A2T2WFN3_9FIRM|nr:MAG: ABC transporter permease [Sulfobacillus acidophilus]
MVWEPLDEGGDKTPTASRVGRWLRRNPGGAVAAGVLLVIYLIVFVGPLIYRVSPITTHPVQALLPPGPGHPLGTDDLGRDVLARLLAGGRVSLIVGVMAMVVSIVVGVLVGALAGFFRGVVEMVLMRVVDAALAIPALILIMVEVTSFGNSPAIIILVIGLVNWPAMARVAFGEVLSLRERTFVEAAYGLGGTRSWILRRHIIPQLIPSILSMATLTIAWSILLESALSFLGLGIQPPLASWGSMLQNAQTYVFVDPILAVFPGLMILITVLSFNALGNALRD